MTTLNTIIEEEKKGAKESVLETFDDGTIRYCPRDLETKITTAMQRAYEAGKADSAHENTPDIEWEKELEQHAPNLTFKSLDNGVNTISMVWLKSFIRTTLTSRDTYWRERVRKAVGKIEESVRTQDTSYEYGEGTYEGMLYSISLIKDITYEDNLK